MSGSRAEIVEAEVGATRTGQRRGLERRSFDGRPLGTPAQHDDDADGDDDDDERAGTAEQHRHERLSTAPAAADAAAAAAADHDQRR